MTLLQQFPDESALRRRLGPKKTQRRLLSQNELNDSDSDQELALYYDNEFKKWHIKLALIIVFIIASLFAALICVSRFL